MCPNPGLNSLDRIECKYIQREVLLQDALVRLIFISIFFTKLVGKVYYNQGVFFTSESLGRTMGGEDNLYSSTGPHSQASWV